MSARTWRGAGAASPTTHAEPLDELGEPFPVVVALVSWVNRYAGGSGEGSVELIERAHPGETIRNLLHRVGESHARLHDALWDPATGDLGPHLVIVVNQDPLGIEYDLDSPLLPGDRLTLTGQYIGE